MAGATHEPESETAAPVSAISAINPSASEVWVAPPPVHVPPTPPVRVPVAPPARATGGEIEAHTDEFLADVAGALSPFGDDIEFPLPIEHLSYRHPGPANRPALAGD